MARGGAFFFCFFVFSERKKQREKKTRNEVEWGVLIPPILINLLNLLIFGGRSRPPPLPVTLRTLPKGSGGRKNNNYDDYYHHFHNFRGVCSEPSKTQ